MKHLTGAQWFKILSNNKYILARHQTGIIIGINCGIVRFKKFADQRHNKRKSQYTAWKPCDFMTYITYKTPFQ